MFRFTCTAAFVPIALAFAVSVASGAANGPSKAMVSGPYVGSYVAKLTEDEASARGDSRLAGKFTLVLRRNGTYTASNPFDGRSHGRLASLSGHRLRFYDDNACKGGGFERPQGGIYRWRLNGKRLTLRLVNEGPCSGRTDTLTFPIWTRN